MTVATGRIRAEVRSGLGDLVLDRSDALNALDPPMVWAITETLREWAGDDSVHTVVVRGATSRAFCAGGDIRLVREQVLGGRTADAMTFFREEYALDAIIAEYPKPYVALLDGVAMGGGLGLSVHGAHRVVTEHSVLAMPETMIGFVPDVGASHFLPRLAPGWGRYLGLTGLRTGATGTLHSGLATHFVPRAGLEELTDALARDGVAALADASRPLPPGPDDGPDPAVLRVFAGTDLPRLEEALEALPGPHAARALAALRAVSPSSVSATDELLRHGAGSELAACLARELEVVGEVIGRPDFDEGVRCALVDRGETPTWNPARPLSGDHR
ncbi:enoyl-CoA hydratase/isomerase family protein [Pseudonocardia nematodicida]|uniref:3-hydroxyisobutyryl-CoA hydrolase n=1 Tax=Pseudonocardia nematodicida TaxID=1206997 RepID=A0ABV1K3C5_9PSEU